MPHPYPTGAEALLIALQTPAPKGYLGIPVMIWGRPGVGKSSFLEGLAREDFPVLTLIASIHDPTDFSGLPVFHEGKVHYAVPEWTSQFEPHGQGLLLLDELTTAPPAVQAALLRVVLERRVGFHALPPGVRIVAAANPPDLTTGGWELSAPLRNRFVHLEWELEPATYLNALQQGWPTAERPTIDPDGHHRRLPFWQLRIAAFLRRAPELLHTPPDEGPYAFASPRSWDFAAALLASCDLLGQAPLPGQVGSLACLALLKGCVGEGAALPLVEFLRHLKLPDPASVLDGEAMVTVAEFDDSELYVLFGGLARELTQRLESPDILLPAERFLQLTETVFADGRRDLVYVALKQVIRAGLFPKMLAAAQQRDKATSERVMKIINHLIKDPGLEEFITAFEK
ncbi:MAG: AAA family ATPase [Lewinella sp.]|nr:AAA family ATPase [Lewinella sp.]